MSSSPVRARDLGIPFEGVTGLNNAITDVAGVHVGFSTLIESAPRPGRRKPVRTGVTAILPHAQASTPSPVWAGFHRFNGNGEMTGTHWIADGGYFTGPVLITNTHGVGMAHHAAVGWMADRYADYFNGDNHVWAMPVVAETYDGVLSDINARAVTETHVREALDSAAPGPVAEGCVGGGSGMICYGYKGGTGTASRRIAIGDRSYTVAALVQANHGLGEMLTISGVPVGRKLPSPMPTPFVRELGSIIVVIATDAPLLPHQLQRIARRGSIGIGRNGTVGGNGSGDLFLAFSTANTMPMPANAPSHFSLEMVNDEVIDAIYGAAVQSVEESVVNALVAATDMGGTQWDEVTIRAINHAELQKVLGIA